MLCVSFSELFLTMDPFLHSSLPDLYVLVFMKIIPFSPVILCVFNLHFPEILNLLPHTIFWLLHFLFSDNFRGVFYWKFISQITYFLSISPWFYLLLSTFISFVFPKDFHNVFCFFWICIICYHTPWVNNFSFFKFTIGFLLYSYMISILITERMKSIKVC